MHRRTLLAAIPAALAAGAAFWWSRGSDQGLPGITPAVAQSGDRIDTSAIPDMVLGSPDAPVTVVEYASFTCPHCATFHRNVLPQLRANYIDTGKVRFVFREVFFDKYGLWAALLARCGGEMRYFGLTGMIFDKQGEWARGSDADIAGGLRKIGQVAGLPAEKVESCLSDAETSRALVARYQEQAVADDITSTPSFVIDGKKYSNMSYDEFAKLLDSKLGG
jgi:protein-disulfide isomerase